LRAIDRNGCEDSVSHQVGLKPSPVAAFTITPDFEGKPGQVRMNNKSTDSVVAWQWRFEPGKGSTEENPVHLFANDGKYNISLIVKSTNGCYDTTYLAYEFLFDNLFIPNALAPDNLSDAIDCRVFRPKGMNLRDYHVMIFDKWGHLLWESKKITDDDKRMPEESWDGTFKGKPMPQDVYVWKISATFENGKVWEGADPGNGTVSTMGTVTLIR
jgi:gliding motility-associated-like protein